MLPHHHVIVVPGLGGSNNLFSTVVRMWKKDGIIPEVFDINWRDNQTDFSTQLKELISRIDQLHRTGKIVSLVGTSAGGSLVLNAFYARTDKVHRIVNICGRLKAGQNVSPSLESASRTSASFRDSVLACEKNVYSLSSANRSRILTVQPLFDEIVPISTMMIPGSRSMKIWSFEHLLSIGVAMIVFSGSILQFLKDE